MRLDKTGDDDYDLIEGGIRIELSKARNGAWQFWNVVINGERFGGTQIISPGPFTSFLDEESS